MQLIRAIISIFNRSSMPQAKADIIARLQKDILSLQGLNPTAGGQSQDMGLGTISNAFPNNCFPTGAIHELLANGSENATASSGFIAGILSSLIRYGGVVIWISPLRTIFPPALKGFGIAPHSIIFLELQKEKDRIWATEEALKCSALSAVVAEIPEISFIQSRRLQLSVEQSKVTGFLLRKDTRYLQTTASVARWQVTSLQSEQEDDLPGVGFPRWKVELLKARNGKPGAWELMWAEGAFHHCNQPVSFARNTLQKIV